MVVSDGGGGQVMLPTIDIDDTIFLICMFGGYLTMVHTGVDIVFARAYLLFCFAFWLLCCEDNGRKD